MAKRICVTEYYRSSSECYFLKIDNVLYPVASSKNKEEVEHFVKHVDNMTGFDCKDMRLNNYYLNSIMYTNVKWYINVSS